MNIKKCILINTIQASYDNDKIIIDRFIKTTYSNHSIVPEQVLISTLNHIEIANILKFKSYATHITLSPRITNDSINPLRVVRSFSPLRKTKRPVLILYKICKCAHCDSPSGCTRYYFRTRNCYEGSKERISRNPSQVNNN